jgi:release factor glutamine methyltransferase
MKIRELRDWAIHQLAGLDTPRLEAEHLIMHVTSWSRTELILNLDSDMSPADLEKLRRLVRRRRDREPLQHITGTVEFLGLEFISGPGALIPRPETEILAELFRDGLDHPCAILDLGTGSGVLAVCLGLEFPDSAVVASDISPQALGLAASNIRMHGTGNVIPVLCDLLSSFGSEVFDGIVANLPYIPSHLLETLQPEVRCGDPAVALDGGLDGLDLIWKFLEDAPGVLRCGGFVALEMDPDQTAEVMQFLEESPMWMDARLKADLAGSNRFVTARKVMKGV